jgi:hypothetical protein
MWGVACGLYYKYAVNTILLYYELYLKMSSRIVSDTSRSVIDDTRVMFQIVASLVA